MTLFSLNFISTHSGNYQHQTNINLVTTQLSILQYNQNIEFCFIKCIQNQQHHFRVTNKQRHLSEENILNFL